MKKNVLKRAIATFMTTTLAFGLIPQIPARITNIYAAENVAPSVEQFASKQELMTAFDTQNRTADKPEKVIIFGMNEWLDDNQEWMIVGQDTAIGDENVVLIARSPLASDPEYSYAIEKQPYLGEEYGKYSNAPLEVLPNHFGASILYQEYLRDGAENSLYKTHFSNKERAAMNQTTYYTKDELNQSVYALTDTLYIPYGIEGETYYTVGSNQADALQTGLRVDSSYCGKGTIYPTWLRTPASDTEFGYEELALYVNEQIFNKDIAEADYWNSNYGCVQAAFNMNLRNVAFASSARAAEADGEVSTNVYGHENAFTLRFLDEAVGSFAIENKGKNVSIQNVRDNGEKVYLVVQNTEGAYAKEVHSGMKIAADTVTIQGEVLDSFVNCKVWLEYTDEDERITSASQAVQMKEYNVSFESNGGSGVVGAYKCIQGESFILPENLFAAPQGKRFLGWAVNTTENTDYKKPNEAIFIEQDTTIYAIWEDLTYTISVNQDAYTFAEHNEGYVYNPTSENQLFTVTNTGNSPVHLHTDTLLYFTVEGLPTDELAPGKTAQFEVGLKKNLSAGNYQEKLVISTEYQTTAEINLYALVHGAFSVNISPEQATITAGDSVELEAMPVGGSGQYTYQWYKNEDSHSFSDEKKVYVTPNDTTTYRVLINDTIEDTQMVATVTVLPKTYSLTVEHGTGTGSYIANQVVVVEAQEAPKGKQFDRWQVVGDFTLDNPNIERLEFNMPEQELHLIALYKELITEPETTSKAEEPETTTPNYRIIDGVNGNYQKESKKTYRIQCDGALSKFVGVEIDGIKVAEENYRTRIGSTIVIFTPDYLDTLDLSKHTVKFVYVDGSADTSLTVKEKKNQTGVEETKPSKTQPLETEATKPSKTQSLETEATKPSKTQPSETEATKPSKTQPSETEATKPSKTQPSETETTKPSKTQPSETEATKPSKTKPSETEATKPSKTQPLETEASASNQTEQIGAEIIQPKATRYLHTDTTTQKQITQQSQSASQDMIQQSGLEQKYAQEQPNTGDARHPFYWGIAMILSGCVCVLMRKKNVEN